MQLFWGFLAPLMPHLMIQLSCCSPSIPSSAFPAVRGFAFVALVTSLIGYAVSFPKQLADLIVKLLGWKQRKKCHGSGSAGFIEEKKGILVEQAYYAESNSTNHGLDLSIQKETEIIIYGRCWWKFCSCNTICHSCHSGILALDCKPEHGGRSCQRTKRHWSSNLTAATYSERRCLTQHILLALLLEDKEALELAQIKHDKYVQRLH
ncbi:hypothetical protein OPV22_034054 [Ensete ventricosum]|uniref:Uncharacterized protein n=1 Tax=Ensete ventricosum TaxID=4639 RepID=A0AAV8PW77_ENSVE|nr:hypothetical protein OPV22_034054 [Ensete ventricosum]